MAAKYFLLLLITQNYIISKNILSRFCSIIVFIFRLEGEDLSFKERSKKQKEQVRDLLLQQMQEKRMKNFIENKEAHDWDKMLLMQDNKALQIELAEQNHNKANAQELSNKNKYLVI